jgi:hypothetical protein
MKNFKFLKSFVVQANGRNIFKTNDHLLLLDGKQLPCYIKGCAQGKECGFGFDYFTISHEACLTTA